MKDIKYSSYMPLARLEKGDKAIIRVSAFPPSLIKDKDMKKYKEVPNGKYEAICVGEYKLEYKAYPVLSGKYNFWNGDKFGCSYGIYADEMK